jgi:SAM-dependent methyltransferase
VPDRRSEASPDLWEQHAGWWQDGFTDGVDPEYEEQILPLAAECLAGAQRVIDVGTGEGQVARLASRLGAEVTGVDPTRAQLRVATERGGGPRYVRAAAERLPFADASFDAAVACLVFEHHPDHEAPIAEIARELAPRGRFVFLLNHPLLQAPNSGWVIDHDLDEQYWRVGSYLPVDVTMEELAPGVMLPFVHRPLSLYVYAMAGVGLVIRRREEPRPPAG